MTIATTIARVLLGVLFLLAGISGFVFLFVALPPAAPGLAGQFQVVFFQSHLVLFVDIVDVIGGALLLSGRYVPLGLVLLGAVIYNILAFHLTMLPQGIVPGLVAFALWGFVSWRYRSSLAPLFARSARPNDI